MNTSGIVLIGAGATVFLLVIIFMIARWYMEKKKQKALAKKDLIERSFLGSSVLSPNGEVRNASIPHTPVTPRGGETYPLLRSEKTTPTHGGAMA